MSGKGSKEDIIVIPVRKKQGGGAKGVRSLKEKEERKEREWKVGDPSACKTFFLSHTHSLSSILACFPLAFNGQRKRRRSKVIIICMFVSFVYCFDVVLVCRCHMLCRRIEAL